jgi:hypothetical protein
MTYFGQITETKTVDQPREDNNPLEMVLFFEARVYRHRTEDKGEVDESMQRIPLGVVRYDEEEYYGTPSWTNLLYSYIQDKIVYAKSDKDRLYFDEASIISGVTLFDLVRADKIIRRHWNEYNDEPNHVFDIMILRMESMEDPYKLPFDDDRREEPCDIDSIIISCRFVRSFTLGV